MAISTISANGLTSGGVTPTQLNTQAQYTGFKNRIINGAMGIAQRSTTYALTTTLAYGSVDRWCFQQGTSANGIANQVASGLAGFQYALKLGRNAGATNAYYINAIQVLETANSYDLAGQSITFSFWAKAGANYSQASSNLGVNVVSGTGTDQSSASMFAGTWTGQNNVISTGPTITTTWTKYTLTGTVPSNATQLGVYFYYLPSGTAGADDNVYITGVQLEAGSVATSFDYRPYGTELQLCQRYYQKVQYSSSSSAGVLVGACYSTADVYTTYTFKTSMRTTPTATFSSQSGFLLLGNGGNKLCNQAQLDNANTEVAELYFGSAAGTLLSGGGCWVRQSTASDYFSFSAEL